jgi:predicted enzyme related to lactoylglutathione lyase
MIKPSGLFLTVESLSPALAFYQNLGFEIRFQDGDRYAALHGNGQKLNLLAASESLPQPLVLGFATDDLTTDSAALRAAGATPVTAPKAGPHETTALLQAPDGMFFLLSEKGGVEVR